MTLYTGNRTEDRNAVRLNGTDKIIVANHELL